MAGTHADATVPSPVSKTALPQSDRTVAADKRNCLCPQQSRVVYLSFWVSGFLVSGIGLIETCSGIIAGKPASLTTEQRRVHGPVCGPGSWFTGLGLWGPQPSA